MIYYTRHLCSRGFPARNNGHSSAGERRDGVWGCGGGEGRKSGRREGDPLGTLDAKIDDTKRSDWSKDHRVNRG